jgi:D-alanine transaminase
MNFLSAVDVVLAYLNGQYLPRSAAAISVEDRGFVFGDGVYEVWRVVNGQLFEKDRHLERLLFGLRELRISPPELATVDGLREVADRLLGESGLRDGEGTLYVEITRGVATRTHHFPPADTPPTVYATVNRFTPPNDLRVKGATAITVPDIRWLRCDLKTLQLLPNAMAKQAAVEAGAVEAILVRDGRVTEGSHTNVLAVIDGVLRTHPTNNFILPGVTRRVVLEIASRLGIPVSEVPFPESDLARVDELFLAGTTTDIMPIVRVNDQTIGNGSPGPIALRIFRELRLHLDASCPAPQSTESAPTTP